MTPKQRQAAKQSDDHTCVECGSKKNLTVDHIVPRAKGGTNHRRNLQVLCQPCNNKKADKLTSFVLCGIEFHPHEQTNKGLKGSLARLRYGNNPYCVILSSSKIVSKRQKVNVLVNNEIKEYCFSSLEIL